MTPQDFLQWFRGTIVLLKNGEIQQFREYYDEDDIQQLYPNRRAIVESIAMYRPPPGFYPYGSTIVELKWPSRRQYRRGAHGENCKIEYVLKQDRWLDPIDYTIAFTQAFRFLSQHGYPQTVNDALVRMGSAGAYPIKRYLYLERITNNDFNLRLRDSIIGEVSRWAEQEPTITFFDKENTYDI